MYNSHCWIYHTHQLYPSLFTITALSPPPSPCQYKRSHAAFPSTGIGWTFHVHHRLNISIMTMNLLQHPVYHLPFHRLVVAAAVAAPHQSLHHHYWHHPSLWKSMDVSKACLRMLVLVSRWPPLTTTMKQHPSKVDEAAVVQLLAVFIAIDPSVALSANWRHGNHHPHHFVIMANYVSLTNMALTLSQQRNHPAKAWVPRLKRTLQVVQLQWFVLWSTRAMY